MQRFNEQLERAMRRVGRVITHRSWYSSGEIIVPVEGGNDINVNYDSGSVDGGQNNLTRNEVKFLGSRFRPHSRSGLYNTDRAVGLLLAHVEEQLLNRRKAKQEEVKRQQWRERRKFAEDLCARLGLDKTNLRVSIDYPYTNEMYEVKITTDCQATVMRLIDHMSDGGFTVKKEDPKPEGGAQ